MSRSLAFARLALALTFALVACAPQDAGDTGAPDVASTDRAPAESTIPDTEIGLSKGSVFDDAEPAAWTADASMPGESELQAPAFAGSPPIVAHGVEDFLPITADENACLMCHLPAAEEPDATALPESHLVDLRNAPDEVRAEVAGARWVCTSCHVAGSDASPLVVSSFASD